MTAEARLIQIVSGGQTGVDRAALDAACLHGVSTGGWCPAGRRAEDGRVPSCYELREADSRNYAVRTEWNVRDSDGTLVLILKTLAGGSLLTVECARKQQKPCWTEHLLPDRSGMLVDENSEEERMSSVVGWLKRHKIRILNVAGPRASSSPDAYPLAFRFMSQLLERLGFPKQEQSSVTNRGRRKSAKAEGDGRQPGN